MEVEIVFSASRIRWNLLNFYISNILNFHRALLLRIFIAIDAPQDIDHLSSSGGIFHNHEAENELHDLQHLYMPHTLARCASRMHSYTVCHSDRVNSG